MKHLKPLLLGFLLLVSCRKSFSDSFAKAERAFAEKDYISTVDTLTNALSNWRASDGNEIKSRSYEMLGKSYHQLRNTDKALEAFSEAVKLSSSSFESAFAMGNIYLAQNHPALAQKSFEDALGMKPEDPMALLGLGNSYFSQKMTAEARDAFQKVLDVSPGVREAMESLALLNKAAPRRHTAAPAKKKTPARKTTQRKRR